jgi:hypothetical protein
MAHMLAYINLSAPDVVFYLLLFIVLPLLALIEVLSDRTLKTHVKIIWTLVIVSIPVFGMVVYLLYSRYQFFFGNGTTAGRSA